MVLLLIGIIVIAIPVGLASLVRSLRLEGSKKTILTILSSVSLGLNVAALVVLFIPALSESLSTIFFLSGLILGIFTLIFAVHCLRKLHNKVFTDKTKEHHESVARLLKEQKEQEEQLKK